MARFEVEVEGDRLGEAQASLNAAGIPTLALGATSREQAGGRPGRRFFRSAAFPIVLVIVLAFLAQRLLDGGVEEASYNELIAQVERAPESIEKVSLDPDDNSIEVEQRGGDRYETGYPPQAEDSLTNTLLRQGIETEVEESGGGSVLGWISYLLPFFLFMGFFLFLVRRMERRGPPAADGGVGPNQLTAVLDAGSDEEAEARVRQALPPGGGHRTRRVTSLS